MLSDAIHKSHCYRVNEYLKAKSAHEYLQEMSDLEGKLQREKNITYMLTDQAFISHLLMRNEIKVITS